MTPLSADSSAPSRLIDLGQVLPAPWLRQAYRRVAPLTDRLLGLEAINRIYRAVQQDHRTLNFFERVLRASDVAYEVTPADLARIPREGPLLVLSNHPFGALDGIVAGALLTSVRDDVKLLVNYLLGQMPEMHPWIIGVDPFETTEAAKANRLPLKASLAHLKAGRCLMTFPSGTVSHWQWKAQRVSDPAWNPSLVRLALKTGASVLPLFFEGRNSWLFQLASIIHPKLRLLSLPREYARRIGTTARVRVGKPISPKRLAEYDTPEEATEFIRLSSYILAERADAIPPRRFSFPKVGRAPRRLQPLVEALPRNLLVDEITALPPARHLMAHNQFSVYWARATEVPSVLEEIGRLREETFREVGEGTGQDTDIDRFDLHYRHLFLWDHQAQAIAGAYRIGLTDELLDSHGPSGLYTSTLFRFRRTFLEELGPALEMGRSFIANAYQRKHATLSLLWKGIGAFVVRHPQYATLFGPVSISPEYQAISRELMVKFLHQNLFDSALASLVQARRPPKTRSSPPFNLNDATDLMHGIEDVSALISEIEEDQKGVPVLLRHYLKLNGKLLAFNVDSDFGDCVDGLIIVDLRKADRKLLRAYLGTEGSASFLAHHTN